MFVIYEHEVRCKEMRYYNNKRYNSARRFGRLRKMLEKTCPKANYCKNADRCDYEHTFVGEKLCFERKELRTWEKKSL